MPDIAIGRQEILDVLHVSSWRTIQKWKRHDEGFREILREHPINKKPFVVIKEATTWMIEYDKLKKQV